MYFTHSLVYKYRFFDGSDLDDIIQLGEYLTRDVYVITNVFLDQSAAYSTYM